MVKYTVVKEIRVGARVKILIDRKGFFVNKGKLGTIVDINHSDSCSVSLDNFGGGWEFNEDTGSSCLTFDKDDLEVIG